MAQVTISLPSLTLTSSAVDTSTQTITAVDIMDAIVICGFVNGNTTAPGLNAQVAFTSESTATFSVLRHDSSGAARWGLTSDAFVIPTLGAKQFRVGSSNVTSTSYTIVLAKQIHL